MSDTPAAIRLATTDEDVARSQAARRQRLARLGLPPDTGLGVVFTDEFVTIRRDAVVFPRGHAGTYLRIMERVASDGVTGVVAVAGNSGGLLLQRIFRYPTDSWEWEFPRGFIEPGVSAIDMARRELLQETGYQARAVHSLGRIKPNTGLCATVAQVFWAELTHPPVQDDLEPGEVISTRQIFPVAEIWRMVGAGAIEDGFTLAALALAVGHGLVRPGTEVR